MDFSTLSHLSKTPGIGGSIKHSPADFIVEEITLKNKVINLDVPFLEESAADGTFTIFVAQKSNWTTLSLIDEISRHLKIHPKFFSYAGIKDRSALTTQLICVSGNHIGAINSLQIKDVKILGSYLSKTRLQTGDLSGNRFTINLNFPVDRVPDYSNLSKISSELNGSFPNYFGPQRFGTNRQNTHLIGQKILQNDLAGAINSILCDIENETNEKVLFARSEFEKTQDLLAALKNFPKHLRIERDLISYLLKKPKDFSGAIKSLPRQLSLLYIHAFQSYLFNLLLSERLNDGPVVLEEGEYFCSFDSYFPNLDAVSGFGPIVGKIIGYKTILSKREKALFEKLNLDKDCFRLKHLSDISSKGSRRLLLCPIIDFKNENNLFSFSLPSGSYATSLLREFMDKKK